MAKNPRIIWQDKIDKEMSPIVGERAVNLSRLRELDIKIPRFFVISTDAFKEFFANVKAEVERELEDLRDDFSSAKRVASNINSILTHNKISEVFQEELFQAYKELSNSDSYSNIPTRAMELIKSGRELAPLTVRLSPQQHLIHFDEVKNIMGITALMNTIKELWTRIFSAKSLYHTIKNNTSYHEYLPAILIYKTVQASKSGDLFSVNPLTNNNGQAYVQAIWGMLGDNFNNPSTFIVDKSTKQIHQSNISRQSIYLTKKSQAAKIEQQSLPEELQTKAPLARPELEKIIDLGINIESQLKFPQHVEWTIGKEIVVTGVEPITNSFKKPLHFKAEENQEATARGIPLVTKDFNGKLTKLKSNVVSNINNDQVLLLDKSNDMFFEAMLNSAGIISQSSGLSSHLAVNCREFNIPSVISVKNAENIFNENQQLETKNGNIIIRETEQEQEKSRESSVEMPSFLQELETSKREPAVAERKEVTSVVEPTIDLDTPRDSEISVDEIISKLTRLEKYITNKVYEEAEKRRKGLVELGEKEQRRTRILQELEWDIRNMKKKLGELI